MENARLYLDCGKICWLAEVQVNGQNAGVVLCPPWRLDITSYCRARREQREDRLRESVEEPVDW
jgi:hypothetical protein